jgi:hypothetical protein
MPERMWTILPLASAAASPSWPSLHWRRVTFTDEQRYDRDGVVLVRGVLTLAGSSGVCAAHRGAMKHLLVPSRLAKLRKALLRRPQGPG